MTTGREPGVAVRRTSTRRDERRLPVRLDRGATTSDEFGRASGLGSGRLQLRVLGPLTIIRDGVEHRGRQIGAVKTRGLLELLLIARGGSVSKDELIHALWDGSRSMPTDPIRTLEHYICVLRTVLTTDAVAGRDVVVTGSNSYSIDTRRIDLDLDRFEHLVRQAWTAGHGERRPLLEAAVSMAAADLFDDSPNRAVAQPMRVSHSESVAAAHLWLAEDGVLSRDFHRAVWHGEQALRSTPLSEQAFRLLMVAHMGLGSRELARLTHRRCVNLLWRSLRLEPTAQTASLAAAIDTGIGFDELVVLLAPASAA